MRAWLRLSALGALVWAWPAAGAPVDDIECPEGTQRIHTDNPYRPFQCEDKAKRRKGLSQIAGPRGFATRPRCPRGTRPLMTPDGLQPYRCVTSSFPAAEPEVSPGLDPAGLAPGGSAGTGPGRAAPPAEQLTAKSFLRYTIPNEISFDFPQPWHLTDAWKDSPPTIYVVYDTGRGGKQVTMTVTSIEPGQIGYQDLNLAVIKEREWQGAADAGRGRVGGLPARFVGVKGSSRSAYVDQGEGRYFILNYSAPIELFETYLPAFQRLLKTFRPAPR